MSEQQRIKWMLVASLVGDKHRERYVHSSSFYAMVNTLAEMVPLWVDGMAAASDEADARAEQAMASTRHAPPLQPWTDMLIRSDLHSPPAPSSSEKT